MKSRFQQRRQLLCVGQLLRYKEHYISSTTVMTKNMLITGKTEPLKETLIPHQGKCQVINANANGVRYNSKTYCGHKPAQAPKWPAASEPNTELVTHCQH